MKFIRKNKKEEGQTLVEFALILPILLLLVVGIIDFGWLFMAKITTNNAAREAARLYAVKGDKPAAVAAAVQALSFIKMEIGPTVVIIEAPSGTPVEAVAQVSGKVKPLVGLFITGNIDVSSTSYMKLEYK